MSHRARRHPTTRGDAMRANAATTTTTVTTTTRVPRARTRARAVSERTARILREVEMRERDASGGAARAATALGAGGQTSARALEGLDASWRAMREGGKDEGGKDGVDGFARRARAATRERATRRRRTTSRCAVGRWGCSWRARCRDEGRGWW